MAISFSSRGYALFYQVSFSLLFIYRFVCGVKYSLIYKIHKFGLFEIVVTKLCIFIQHLCNNRHQRYIALLLFHDLKNIKCPNPRSAVLWKRASIYTLQCFPVSSGAACTPPPMCIPLRKDMLYFFYIVFLSRENAKYG